MLEWMCFCLICLFFVIWSRFVPKYNDNSKWKCYHFQGFYQMQIRWSRAEGKHKNAPMATLHHQKQHEPTDLLVTYLANSTYPGYFSLFSLFFTPNSNGNNRSLISCISIQLNTIFFIFFFIRFSFEFRRTDIAGEQTWTYRG